MVRFPSTFITNRLFVCWGLSAFADIALLCCVSSIAMDTSAFVSNPLNSSSSAEFSLNDAELLLIPLSMVRSMSQCHIKE